MSVSEWSVKLRESWLTVTLYFKGHFLCFSKQINIFQLCLKFTLKQFSQSRFLNCAWTSSNCPRNVQLFASLKSRHSTKNCYNWEYASEEVLIDNYVSIFNSHDFFIQINYSNWNQGQAKWRVSVSGELRFMTSYLQS